MGYGLWNVRSVFTVVEYRRPCECGNGNVLLKVDVDVEATEEHPLGRILGRYVEKNCPNKCE
ncbi:MULTISPECIES: hypothetical protein [Lysinibacillus]|uniref:Uncharacterized protein n=1 Tax=Lysinibacillus antri TaxID=2498145 RepID=A0A3S0P7N1_9BACI|nr:MULTISPECIES: hypothetical protein [Lysinibacillus]RUL55610.1 hypothetical protein EK386_04600 [Lysinibacillus antri]TSI02517.1 hypothetical protein FJQ64_18135 [Lysinibacillus sp. BW-2-10]